MKKVFSLLLAVLMLVSALPVAYAADYTAGTQVVYTAANNESYIITVPASLKPGQSGTVTLAGEWPDNKTISVTADETVTLTNSLNAADQKTLDVTFAGMEKAGNNTEKQKFTETVSVADIEAALFGTWNGHFYYNVESSEGSGGSTGNTSTTCNICGSPIENGVCALSGFDGTSCAQCGETMGESDVCDSCGWWESACQVCNGVGQVVGGTCDNCGADCYGNGVDCSVIGACYDKNNDDYCDCCGTSLEQANLISFTIDSTEFQAEEGMTWAQWLNSDYNTEGYYVSAEDGIWHGYEDETSSVYTEEMEDEDGFPDYTYTLCTDTIIANHDYFTI